MFRLIRSLHNPQIIKQSIATIGNFDGLHLGHQQLINKVNAIAKSHNLPSSVILFEPQPNEFFSQETPTPRLMTLREKLICLKEMHIHQVICLCFNQSFSQLSAEAFVKDILVDCLAIRHILIGDDFRFGYKRMGDIEVLKTLGQRYGFTAEAMEKYTLADERISSSRIRQALQQGQLKEAELLLGRLFYLSGRVIHGDKRGRLLGFPTANIKLTQRALPLRGVYAVKVYGINNQILLGVANIGNRPTVDGTRNSLEVHLFNFNQDIYGKRIHVKFIQKIRDEIKFNSLEQLKQQIIHDANQAKVCMGDSVD